ncbi:MAG: phosphate/phosphite/phosphonate ABC transporter substrate-binding protein [Gammaproteobacteria bacterium]|nr:phosphate/phosphite/phosphonate ABC transporter substrate-binding protein [Gammaproteobacteria bacterium]
MRLLANTRTLTLVALLFLSLSSSLQAAGFRLVVPPFLPQAEMKNTYSKMANYLSQNLGAPVELVTSGSYLAHWEMMRKGSGYELALDNAPMIDFLVQRQHYTVLTKIAGVISQSLVTRDDVTILDPQELLGKPVATIASPNLSALVLFEMFPNPLRQPNFKYANNAREAIDMVLKGQVVAALVPTPIAVLYDNLNVVTTSKPLPHLAIAASPGVPTETQAKIRQILLQADKTPEGRAMLKILNTSGFEPASNATYAGQADLLKGTYGY